MEHGKHNSDKGGSGHGQMPMEGEMASHMADMQGTGVGKQMPGMEFHHNPGNATVGSASPMNPSHRKHYDEMHGDAEANLHTQHVKENHFDSPAAFK